MKIRYMKYKVKRHLNLIFQLFFQINIRVPIKHTEKRLNLIEKFIICSLRNIKAIKTVILNTLKT